MNRAAKCWWELGPAGKLTIGQCPNLKDSCLLLQVEDEMRELLHTLERQKAASAAKMKQLATVLQDMHS